MNTRILIIIALSAAPLSSWATPFGKVLLAKIVNVEDGAFICMAKDSRENFPVRGFDVLEAAEGKGARVLLDLKVDAAPQVMSSAHCLKIGFDYPQYISEGDLDLSKPKYNENYSFRVYRVEDAENPYTFLNGSFCILKTSDGKTEYVNAGDAGNAHDRARCRAAWDERQRAAGASLR